MSEKRRNWLVAPKLHKLVVVARSLRESKPPQENGCRRRRSVRELY